jgi:uncharacterized protein YjbI with pentapeptide repeats
MVGAKVAATSPGRSFNIGEKDREAQLLDWRFWKRNRPTLTSTKVAGRTFASFRGELLCVLVVLAAVLALWLLPKWEIKQWPAIETKDQFSSVNEARKTIATILGGLVVLLGAYFTWRNIAIAKEGQITDRFTKAIEQLGAVHSDGKPKIEVRLGGIYALARMARQYQSDWPICEVFCAYIRQNSPNTASADVEKKPDAAVKPSADIEAILRFLGSYDLAHTHTLDLSRVDLRNLDLPNAILRGVDFSLSNLSGANLRQADLDGAKLRGANVSFAVLENAKLRGTTMTKASMYATELGWSDLSGSDLSEAKLSSTRLPSAILTRAKLLFAELQDTFLGGADLSGADLGGATLNEVNLGHANLTNANLSGAEVGSVKFGQADLTNTDLSDLDLMFALDLTEQQVQLAKGTTKTRLPRSLKRPAAWS